MDEDTRMHGRDSPVFFEFKPETDAFDAAVIEMLRSQQREFVKKNLPEENTERFSHGGAWTHRANPEAMDGKVQTLSSGWEIRFDDLIRGDLSLIRRKLDSVSQDMQRQFMEMLYATISASTEATGNVVDAKAEGSIAASFLEMLKRIELTVDRNGEVKMPEVHVAPALGRKMIAELEAQPPEFIEHVERVKAEKIASAFEREKERKAHFKRYQE
jgi:hypothetical protein